jgi:outer membrane protein
MSKGITVPGAPVFILILSFLFLVLGTADPTSAGAQAQTFTLAEAVKFALQNNNEIRAAESSLAAKQDDIGVARSGLLPKIYFEERALRTNNPTYVFMSKLNQGLFTAQDFAIQSLNQPDPYNDFQTQFFAEQPIFVPKAWVGVDMSQREHQAGSIDLSRKKEEIAFRVCQAWLMVHTARAQLDAAGRGVEDAKEHYRIAKLRYEADLGMYADTLRASTALAESRQRKVTADKQTNLARRMLGLLLGLTGSADVEGEIPDFPLKDIDDYARSSQARGDIRSMELRYENAEKNIRMTETDYLPYVGIGGGYQWNDPANLFGGSGDSWQVSAFLRWNLFDGAKREYERSKAKHQARQAQENLSGMKKAAAYGLYQAQLGLEEAKANLELAREALKTAEEGTRLVQMRYESSFSPIVDVLDAQVALDRARVGVVARENDYRVAVLNLGWESGTILKDLGIAQDEKKE